jgi:hypothetical protein
MLIYFSRLPLIHPSYLQDNFNDWEVVYPFHVACFKILTKVLAHVAGVDLVNKDYLYEVMEQLAGEDCYSALPIDYGDIRGPDQFWSCTAGEEVGLGYHRKEKS